VAATCTNTTTDGVPKITRCQQQQSGDGDGEIDGGVVENVKAIVELAERIDANGRKHIRIAKVSRPGESMSIH
jgi:hypothetical protein